MRRFSVLCTLPGLAGLACASTPASAPTDAAQSQPAAHAHHEGGHAHHEGGHDKHMQHSFDDPEKWAQRFDAPERAAWQKPEAVVALLELQPGMTVADIGAGTGYFLPHLSPAVGPTGRVLALDIEPKLVAYMQARAKTEGLDNVQAKTVAPDDPQLEGSSTDRVLIVDTWHHIGARVDYGKKLWTGLKPGGAVYIVDFTMDSPTGPPADFRIPPEAVVATLKAAGLAAEVLQEDLPNQYVVRGRRPLED